MIGAPSWQAEVAAALGAQVTMAEQIPGGDLNDAFHVRLADHREVFVNTPLVVSRAK